MAPRMNAITRMKRKTPTSQSLRSFAQVNADEKKKGKCPTDSEKRNQQMARAPKMNPKTAATTPIPAAAWYSDDPDLESCLTTVEEENKNKSFSRVSNKSGSKCGDFEVRRGKQNTHTNTKVLSPAPTTVAYPSS